MPRKAKASKAKSTKGTAVRVRRTTMHKPAAVDRERSALEAQRLIDAMRGAVGPVNDWLRGLASAVDQLADAVDDARADAVEASETAATAIEDAQEAAQLVVEQVEQREREAAREKDAQIERLVKSHAEALERKDAELRAMVQEHRAAVDVMRTENKDAAAQRALEAQRIASDHTKELTELRADHERALQHEREQGAGRVAALTAELRATQQDADGLRARLRKIGGYVDTPLSDGLSTTAPR